MPKFSQRSKRNLETCEPQLVSLFEEVVQFFDCTVLFGRRNKTEQDEAFKRGTSKVRWPNSKHNTFPLSKAADVVPFPVDWTNRERMILFAGFVKGIATSRGIKIRWGGDFNRNNDPRDDGWDLAHFELED